ncbi:CheY-P-specific phosphatase CheC [Petrocella atlantisensis]|uniref:CheY-P-specific phosphatase CheC n=1 Tax=Petrocella atlantisensis TaxID=2173034 RepID=A0A3P7RTU6_9FIRM|nr:chemotaxis protein CheC [Petrocella atlantisensis]MCF8018491.1 chemotaxis protein CheC [Vallitaleaceae bacterium]VDN46296.1 CheY-P-specific phosphatase CheC [Petrocella atlantisensis]
MMDNFDNIDSVQLDILKEIGNIGAGNATTALSQLINRRIDMGIPVVKVLEFKDLSEVLGGAENPIVGILLGLEGEISGMIMFVLEQSAAHILINMLMGKNIDNFDDFDEMDLSALKEIGNIISGAYLSSLSSLTNLKILATIPYMAIDMAGAILSVPAIEFGKVGDKALLIQTDFGGDRENVFGYFILIPDMPSYGIILRSLGIDT